MFSHKDPRRRALIVASGPSALALRDVTLDPAKVAIIAVNGVADWYPHFHYWFTLDPSPANRARMANPRPGAQYYLAYPESKILLPEHVLRLERISENPGRQAVMHNGKYSCAVGLNTTPGHINSGNSAFGALGLAYHLGFKEVALIGVDASSSMRVEGGHSRDLSHLPQLFESAMAQIKLVNCGQMISQVPKQTLKQFLKGSKRHDDRRLLLHPELAV